MSDALRQIHAELGIAPDYANRRGLVLCPQASQLTPLGLDVLSRDQFAAPAAAIAWASMRDAAALQGIALQLVSAFRSIDYQAALIRRKLQQGQSIDDILQVSAAPGYSEHHTGLAFDLTTPGSELLEISFADTSAFAWLMQNAADFGFYLSYPQGNPYGIAYEPWHWAFRATETTNV